MLVGVCGTESFVYPPSTHLVCLCCPRLLKCPCAPSHTFPRSLAVMCFWSINITVLIIQLSSMLSAQQQCVILFQIILATFWDHHTFQDAFVLGTIVR
jgi:hypothetical protein